MRKMMTHENMMPIGMQAPVPRRKVSSQRKKETANFTTKTLMVANSVQNKKSLIPWKSIDSLPSISGLIIEAIASCKSHNGLTFAELKEVLGTKGYDVRRHYPRLKRKLQSLVSKGALVRMTCGNGSSSFVVRKYQEKITKISRNLEKAARIKKAGMCASEKIKGKAEEAKSLSWKAGKIRRKPKRSHRKLKAGQKPSRRSVSQSKSVERTPNLCQRALSAAKKSSSAGSKSNCAFRESHHSNQGSASVLRRSSRNCKNTGASFFKTAQSSLDESAPKRCRPSRKGLPPPVKVQVSPYYKDNLLAKQKSHCRRVKKTYSTKRQSRRRIRAAFHPPRRTSFNSEKVPRR
ncbi:histone H1C-like [Pseudonaja textilis]|uniref:histone H1C-like n=1 Tax=Pseudonaja textilis TaxID=8673 RepID=UPI000EA89DF4|nr:histone H1C-like [Pseudonaja textilis]XP_026576499.1 histone H1C-like [Pseudonaja textilis]